MLSISPVFFVFFLLMNIVILLPIGPYRLKVGIPFWGGEDKLDRIVRGHGNFIEIIPLFLIALAMAEYLGTAAIVLWVCGLMMVLARLIHYVGMVFVKNTMNGARLVGTVLSLTSLLILAISIGWNLTINPAS